MPARKKTSSQRKTNFVLNPLFSNLNLLREDPLKLRFRHFIAGFPQPRFDEMLHLFWHHAYKYLWQKDQLVCETDLGRLENEAYLALYDDGEYGSPFTDAQRNAIEVFRCIRRLQRRLYQRTPIYEQSGPVQYDPIGFEEDDNKQQQAAEWLWDAMKDDPEGSLAKLEHLLQQETRVFGLEVMYLTLAAVKCDFYGYIWHMHRLASLPMKPQSKNVGAIIFIE